MKNQDNFVKAVAYARYSSDNQRNESIDAQLRAIKKFAQHNDILLVDEYVDRAKSATTDQRFEFQKMIEMAKKKMFNMVIVHKLDRFARNRYDSLIYRHELEKYNVKIRSVTEQFDDSPESMILQAIIKAYNEFYSKNLAREVEKGKLENSLKGRHIGGIPPLGYDIDRKTMKLIINRRESAAVQLIFDMYLDGYSYSQIMAELSDRGFKTKKGKNFGKGSLHEILRKA